AGEKIVQIAEKVIDFALGEEQTATKVKRGVPLDEVQDADKDQRTIALGDVQPVGADDPRRIKPEDIKPGDPPSAVEPFGIAFGDMKSLRASDVVNADDASAARQKLAGGDAPVRQGTTVVEHAKGMPAPDLEKDAKDIREATKRDDTIDLGTDKKAIFKAMEG